MNHQKGTFNQLRQLLTDGVAPLQYLADAPDNLMHTVRDNVKSQLELLSENKALKKEVLLLNARLQTLLALEKENTQLKALLSAATHVTGHVLVARLLAVDPDPFVHQVLINKGSKSGVYVGQPVLDAHGVMGQVIHVGSLTSSVLLLTDSRSAIPVQDNRNGVRSIIEGKGKSDTLALSHMPNTTKIKKGDLLVTSGLGLRFPMGYPVGRVLSVKRHTGEAFAEITVQPSAHINRSRQVLLVWSDSKESQINKQAEEFLKKRG